MMVLLWGGGPVMECQSEIYPTSKLLPKGRVDFHLFQGFYRLSKREKYIYRAECFSIFSRAFYPLSVINPHPAGVLAREPA